MRDAMGEQELELEIRSLDGQSTRVCAKPHDTVGGLKKLLQEKQLITPSLPFHLFLRGLKLSTGNSIQSLVLREGEFMVLMPYSRKKQTAVVLHQNDVSRSSERDSSKATILVGEEKFCTRGLSDFESGNAGRVSQEEAMGTKKNSQQNYALDSAVDVSDSVWNAIAADLSAWRSAVDEGVAVIDTDASPDLTHEHTEEREPIDSNTMNMCTSINLVSSSTMKERKRHLDHEVSLNLEVCAKAHSFSEESENLTKHNQAGLSKQKRARKNWSCPTVLERYYQIFRALNLVYGFLQKQHMQGTWQNMKAALQQLCGASGENIQINEIETLVSLFPKLLQISCRVGEGESESFNLDLLDPTKVPHQDMPRSLHKVMPFELQKRIGPSDHLPTAGVKQISDSLIKSSIKKRLTAFEAAVTTLMENFQALSMKGQQTCSKGEMNDFTLDDLLQFTNKLQDSKSKEQSNHKLDMALPRPPRQHKKLARCMDMADLSAAEMVEHLRQGLGSLGQIVHCEVIEQREADYGQVAVALSDPTAAALRRLHISKLYKHQAEAINAAMAKQNVIIATSTASGKSVCYNIPVLEDLFSNTESCSLYLFPTKALAQDQHRALLEMTSGFDPPISLGVYDGDTPQNQRLHLRDHARLLITNPDMLHVSILPSHKQFERLLSNLRYVVVDEAHAYRGAFGCHTAVILRRLRRLCHHLYGTDPTFIVSSATVANPREHAMELIGLRAIKVVQQDGSPCGKKYFLLWDPPVYYTTKAPPKAQDTFQGNTHGKKKEREKKQLHCKHSSPIVEVSSLLSEMVQHNLRCISFCKTRKLSELVLSYTREILKETAPSLVNSIRAYRAGYTAQDRRDIESALFSGKLHAVAATNALELGVDVGSLDATLHLGFPGTVASLWQQAGRAGRREKPSLSIYVAFGSPLDQYFMRHAQKLFSRAIEHAQIDASNPQVLDEHIACAAVEHPLNVQYDEDFFGSGFQTSITRLVCKGLLGHEPMSCAQDKNWHYIGQERSPAQSVGIRAVDPEKYTIVNQATNEVIEEVEESKAFFEVYEGAVYIHQGRTYLVKTLDLGAKVAVCKEADLKYYTKTRDFTDVHVIGGELAYPRKAVDCKCPATTAQASLCTVTTRWIGFRRIWQGTNQTFDSVDLFLPDYSYESQAAWIRVPHAIRLELDNKGLPFRAGLHAASHALLNIMPLYILCNSSDLGTECANPHDTRYFPERLLVFDRHPGGIGIAAQAQPLFAELLQAAVELLTSCDCTLDMGCPNCVQYLACSEYNEVLNKPAAIAILQGVIDAEDSYRQDREHNPSEEGS